MHLVEQHIIKRSDSRFASIDAAAFKAKNLYNAANYLVRQSFIFEQHYLGYAALFHLLKHHEAYTALPRKVSNDILRQLDKNWRAFFAACEAYREDPGKFTGRPKLFYVAFQRLQRVAAHPWHRHQMCSQTTSVMMSSGYA